MSEAEQKELDRAQRREEISWLQEAALTMRVKLDKQPDNLGPQSDKVALRILARIEADAVQRIEVSNASK